MSNSQQLPPEDGIAQQPQTQKAEKTSPGMFAVPFPARPRTAVRGSIKKALGLMPLVAVLILSVGLLKLPIDFKELANYGYLGVFLVTLITSGTVIFHLPGYLAVFAAGSLFDPFWVGMVASVGSALGELSGYFVGYCGTTVVSEAYNKRYSQLQAWMKRHGTLTIFVFAVTPNPLFDLAGIAAGTLRFPLWEFFLACWAGQVIKSLAQAYIGWHTLHSLLPFLF